MTDYPTPSTDESTDMAAAPESPVRPAVPSAEPAPTNASGVVGSSAESDPAPAPGVSREAASSTRSFSWWRYLVKAVVLVAVLFGFSRVSGVAPGWCVAVVWALASAFLAVGATYHAVVRKTFRQAAYRQGGMLARWNGGRIVRLIVVFVVSAVCVAGLILASASWDAWEWGTAAAAILVLLLVYMLVDKLFRKQLVPLAHASRTACVSGAITAVLSCAVAFGLLVLQQPEVAAISAAQLAESVEDFNAFSASPSALMAEVGLLGAYADALWSYGLTRVGELSTTGRYLVEMVLQASALFGLVGLLSTCTLNWRELKRVFLPLEQLKGEATGESAAPACSASDPQSAPEAPARSSRPSPLPATVVAAVAAPLALFGAFLAADNECAQLKQAGELTPIEDLVRDAFGATVYVLDGTYYDQRQAQAAMQEAAAKSAALDEEARATLVPLINESFDKQVANVDSYLDWYYSLGADYERLGNLITGTVEQFVADQLTASLQEGVDDSQLQEALQGYVDQAAALKADYEEQLEAAKLGAVPEWLVVASETVSATFFDEPVAPTQKLLDTGERLGISAAAGVAGGVSVGKAVAESAGKKAAASAATDAAEAVVDTAVDAAEKTAAKEAVKAGEKSVAKEVASKVAEKAVEKSFFKAIVSRITSMLASRGIGAAAGGVVGTVAGPAGTLAGVAAGAAIGVGVDYAALMIDQSMNRETYKAEIVEAIEAERSELLAQLGEGGE